MNLQKQGTGGFTLIEVLVAIVIFTIGLVGIAGLLVSVITRNQSSIYHSVAVTLASDIAERMRANNTATADYVAQLTSGQPVAASTDCGLATSTCSVGDMAKWDADQWTLLVKKVLPSGRGVVCMDSSASSDDGSLSADGAGKLDDTGCDATGGSIVIKLLWSEARNGRASANATDSEVVKNTQRYAIVFKP